jgi:hypothetical protein
MKAEPPSLLMRLLRAAARFLLSFCLAAAASAQQQPGEASVVDRLPRAWCGVFRWDDDTREQYVTIAFARVSAGAEGRIMAEGSGLVRYTDEPPAKAVPFRIRAIIEPATRRIELFEALDVPRIDYVTDGSHVGDLAPDLRSMRTVWTTRGTGHRGTMELHARPAQADLAQTCAPLSS